MKKRRTEICLILIALLFAVVTFVVEAHQGLTRADGFNFGCKLLLLLMWAVVVIRSKPNK